VDEGGDLTVGEQLDRELDLPVASGADATE